MAALLESSEPSAPVEFSYRSHACAGIILIKNYIFQAGKWSGFVWVLGAGGPCGQIIRGTASGGFRMMGFL